MKKSLTAIDLFCGAGGLTEGLRQAGVQVLAGNEFDEAAGATFAATHRDAKFLPCRCNSFQPLTFFKHLVLVGESLIAWWEGRLAKRSASIISSEECTTSAVSCFVSTCVPWKGFRRDGRCGLWRQA